MTVKTGTSLAVVEKLRNGDDLEVNRQGILDECNRKVGNERPLMKVSFIDRATVTIE